MKVCDKCGKKLNWRYCERWLTNIEMDLCNSCDNKLTKLVNNWLRAE